MISQLAEIEPPTCLFAGRSPINEGKSIRLGPQPAHARLEVPIPSVWKRLFQLIQIGHQSETLRGQILLHLQQPFRFPNGPTDFVAGKARCILFKICVEPVGQRVSLNISNTTRIAVAHPAGVLARI